MSAVIAVIIAESAANAHDVTSVGNLVMKIAFAKAALLAESATIAAARTAVSSVIVTSLSQISREKALDFTE